MSFSQGIHLLLPYLRKRLFKQIRSVAFITLYLIAFQTLVLRVPIFNGFVVGIGMALVVIGLMFFMEGIFLGIMPLGELLGLKLPRKAPLFFILLFSFIIGIGATLAEPAIGILRSAGAGVKAWDAPLLFLLLNRHPDYILFAIGTGVGLAVLFGTLRFYYQLSLKPFVTILTLILTALSIWSYFNPNLIHLIGIAWDSGGVTTGPVTVPLVLALGIGICRIVGGTGLGASGFGVVALASLFPVITVQLLGLPFLNSVPEPMSAHEFVSEQRRSEVIGLFGSEEEFTNYLYNNFELMSRLNQNSGLENDRGAVAKPEAGKFREVSFSGFAEVVLRSVQLAIRAVVPLVIFLVAVLMLFLREKLPRSDVIITGAVFALLGMVFFNIGMELGLAEIGNQVGRVLPSTFRSISLPEEQRTIDNFDTTLIQTAVTSESNREPFFYFSERTAIVPISFDRAFYDEERMQYTHIPMRGPLLGEIWGLLILLMFTFFMGYGATFAEPALNALGVTVEELTVGTFKRGVLINAVATGVGIGLVFGMIRIIWDIPLVYVLLPPYLLVLLFTWISSEEFVAVGWDCGGVTTGPVTVPLVLAMGLAIGGQLDVVEGFGVLALASIWPILIVLTLGMVLSRRNKLYTQDLTGKSEGAADG